LGKFGDFQNLKNQLIMSINPEFTPLTEDGLGAALQAEKENPILFPLDIFPKPVANSCRVVSEVSHFSKNHIGAAILATAAAIVGNTHKIAVKPGLWEEPATLYMTLVGDSSTKKSPAIKFATRPAWQIEEKYQESYEAAENEERENFVVKDATPEALSKILANSPRGVFKIQDELTGWANSFDQYKGGKGAEEEFWLSLFSGMPDKINRVGSSTFIKGTTCTILGGIQPELLGAMATDKRLDSGFMNRLLFTPAEPMPLETWSDRTVPREIYNAWNDFAAKMFSELNFLESEYSTVFFGKEAKKHWVKFFNEFKVKEHKEPYRRLKSVYGKMVAYCARFALILHCMTNVYTNSNHECVSEKDMLSAIRLAKFYMYHSIEFQLGFVKGREREAVKAGRLANEVSTLEEVAKIMNVGKGTVSKYKKDFPQYFPQTP
jgi:hypothetical protein